MWQWHVTYTGTLIPSIAYRYLNNNHSKHILPLSFHAPQLVGVTVHFAVSYLAVSHYRTLNLTPNPNPITLSLKSGKRRSGKRQIGKRLELVGYPTGSRRCIYGISTCFGKEKRQKTGEVLWIKEGMETIVPSIFWMNINATECRVNVSTLSAEWLQWW